MGLGAGPERPRPQPHYLHFLVNYTLAVYTFILYVKIFIRWEALYVLTLYILTLYVGKHYMLGSFIRSDVIR
jgi:hypothetical protein